MHVFGTYFIRNTITNNIFIFFYVSSTSNYPLTSHLILYRYRSIWNKNFSLVRMSLIWYTCTELFLVRYNRVIHFLCQIKRSYLYIHMLKGGRDGEEGYICMYVCVYTYLSTHFSMFPRQPSWIEPISWYPDPIFPSKIQKDNKWKERQTQKMVHIYNIKYWPFFKLLVQIKERKNPESGPLTIMSSISSM